jgi:hypothetical protein
VIRSIHTTYPSVSFDTIFFAVSAMTKSANRVHGSSRLKPY